MIHNSHVIKYYRWKAFVAKEQNRWLAYEFFKEWANEEMAKGAAA